MASPPPPRTGNAGRYLFLFLVGLVIGAAGLGNTVGIGLGCLIWGAAVSLGLGALLHASELAYSIVKLAGAADAFYAFTEVDRRAPVGEVADAINATRMALAPPRPPIL